MSTTKKSGVLFVQKRSFRAGAQVSLSRLVESAPLKELQPSVLLGSDGWLLRVLEGKKIRVARVDFPSPRAVITRLLGYRAFVRRAHGVTAKWGSIPRAIIANDHQECPLALALSAHFDGVPVVGILRTSGMDHADFIKYQCDRCAGLVSVGETLANRIQGWTGQMPEIFQEGFREDEFYPPLPQSATFPSRLLVIGSEAPQKGFSDLIMALDLIEAKYPGFPGVACDFTGDFPSEMAGRIAQPRRSTFRFLGRVEAFTELVRKYPLVVHPSRRETFGLAPVEAMLAGVPALVSATGVVNDLPLPPAWVFAPSCPEDLAARLVGLWRKWPEHQLKIGELQQYIRAHYHIDQTALPVRRLLNRLGIISASTADH